MKKYVTIQVWVHYHLILKTNNKDEILHEYSSRLSLKKDKRHTKLWIYSNEESFDDKGISELVQFLEELDENRRVVIESVEIGLDLLMNWFVPFWESEEFVIFSK